MTYDADGLRRKKEEAAATANFIWDAQKVLLEMDAADSTVAEYILSTGIYGDLISQRRNSTSHFLHFDALGSTDRLTGADEAVTDSYTYYAFGEERASSGTTTNPYRYVGRLGYYRNSTDLLYLRARYYVPAFGRFLSVDPLMGRLLLPPGALPSLAALRGEVGWPAGEGVQGARRPSGAAVRAYLYAANGPCNAVDPSGLFSSAWCVVICVPAGPLYWTCLERCTAANDLNELRKILNKVMKLRGTCKNPKTPADCWLRCPGRGRMLESHCKCCCINFEGQINPKTQKDLGDECSAYCEYWSGKIKPPGAK